MARRESDQPPKIRVLAGFGDEAGLDAAHPDRNQPQRRVAAVLVGFLGVLVGVILGSSLVRSPQDTAADPALEGLDTVTTTTTTAAPTTTVPDPPPLRDLVPGFDGTLRWIPWAAGEDQVVVWDLDAVEGSRTPLPPLARPTYAWDSSGEWLASLAGGVGRFDLYVGRFGDLGPLALGVDSFAWHSDDPGRLAWIEIFEGRTELRVLDLAAPTPLPANLGPIDGDLIAWGEWGFLVQEVPIGKAPRLVSLGPDLARRGEHEAIVSHRTNGIYATAVATSLTPLDIVDPSTGGLVPPADPVPAAFEAYVNPASRQVLTVEPSTETTSVMWLRSLDESTATAFRVPGHLVLDWSPDGRWILVDSQRSVSTPRGVRRLLVVIDTAAEEVFEVPYSGSRIVAAAIRPSSS